MIILFAGMVFLFLSNFGILGPVGNVFSNMMFGMTGFTAYLLPVMIFGLVLYYTTHEDDPTLAMKIGGAIGIFIILGIICELVSGKLPQRAFYDIEGIYKRCADNKNGGGIVAGSITYLLYRLFKIFGTVLILIVSTVICVVLLTQKSVINFMGEQAKDAKARHDQRRLEEEQYRLEHPEEFEEDGEYDDYEIPTRAQKSFNPFHLVDPSLSQSEEEAPAPGYDTFSQERDGQYTMTEESFREDPARLTPDPFAPMHPASEEAVPAPSEEISNASPMGDSRQGIAAAEPASAPITPEMAEGLSVDFINGEHTASNAPASGLSEASSIGMPAAPETGMSEEHSMGMSKTPFPVAPEAEPEETVSIPETIIGEQETDFNDEPEEVYEPYEAEPLMPVTGGFVPEPIAVNPLPAVAEEVPQLHESVNVESEFLEDDTTSDDPAWSELSNIVDPSADLHEIRYSIPELPMGNNAAEDTAADVSINPAGSSKLMHAAEMAAASGVAAAAFHPSPIGAVQAAEAMHATHDAGAEIATQQATEIPDEEITYEGTMLSFDDDDEWVPKPEVQPAYDNKPVSTQDYIRSQFMEDKAAMASEQDVQASESVAASLAERQSEEAAQSLLAAAYEQSVSTSVSEFEASVSASASAYESAMASYSISRSLSESEQISLSESMLASMASRSESSYAQAPNETVMPHSMTQETLMESSILQASMMQASLLERNASQSALQEASLRIAQSEAAVNIAVHKAGQTEIAGEVQEIRPADFFEPVPEPIHTFPNPVSAAEEAPAFNEAVSAPDPAPAPVAAAGSAAQMNAQNGIPQMTQQSGAQQQNAEPAKPAYVFPPMELLRASSHEGSDDSAEELRETAVKLQSTLATFGVNVHITDISQGPAVTRYEMLPEQGVKVSSIVKLSDDIKLALAATDIRIEAPIPGKSAVGIEVPNKTTNLVTLRDVIDTPDFVQNKSKTIFGVGKDIAGKSVISDIAKMPHVLIAGATGSGKSVCINTIIMSILYHASPREVKMIMIDPKVVELSVYNGIPHLMLPVVTDTQKAAATLNWAVAEMEARFRKFADAAVRDIKGYNALVASKEAAGESDPAYHFMPHMVVIVDELADLMMAAKSEVETAICRLAQLARAAGIHLIIATQRPSVDVITGLIKANMPSRIAFAVTQGVDSRTILDMNGAEKLLGKGDMLFFPQGLPKPQRVQGAFVSDDEVTDVVQFLKQHNAKPEGTQDLSDKIDSMAGGGSSQMDSPSGKGGPEIDDLFVKAGKFIIEKNNASVGLLQRMFRIGFNRAARIMDQLCDAGVVSDSEGTKARRILMTEAEFDEYVETTL